MLDRVAIEFPAYVGRLLRGPVVRGLHRWAAEHGYPLSLDEDRGTFGSRYWVQVTVPAELESEARATLADLDTKRWRQARWAWRARHAVAPPYPAAC